jgi:valyl-tRNA synthetase
VINAARGMRADLKLDPKRRVAAEFSSSAAIISGLVFSNRDLIMRLASFSSLDVSSKRLESHGGLVRSTAQFDLRIVHSDSIDVGAEKTKLRKEKDRIEKSIESKRRQLADQTFLSRAPENIVSGLKNAVAELEGEHQKILDRLKELEGQIPRS